MYLQSETSFAHMGFSFLLPTSSLQAYWLQKKEQPMNARHVLLYLLYQLDMSIGDVYTSNTHAGHGDTQEWEEGIMYICYLIEQQ